MRPDPAKFFSVLRNLEWMVWKHKIRLGSPLPNANVLNTGPTLAAVQKGRVLVVRMGVPPIDD